jgi:MtrB/PioB family decaheme-associated outer membrane protein
MKRNRKYQLQLAIAACLVLPFSSPLLADEAAQPDTSNWACKFCVVSDGWFGDLEFGATYLDDWSPKFGDYRGYDDDGAFLHLAGDASYRSENGYYMDFYARDLGLDSRALDMRGGKQGSYEWRAGYDEIPRYMSYGAVSPYAGVGSDVLTLPDGWKMTTADPSDFLPIDLESKRKTLTAGLTFGLGSAWKFDADYERQTKDGTKAFSGGLFFVNAAIFPAPVDYTTDLFTAGVEWATRKANLRLEFAGSDFDNGYNSVTWDNPLPIISGDEVSRSALEPDNKYHLVSLSGSWRITRSLRISGKVSSGEVEQNDPFLPYSISPAYEDTPLPRDALDGKLETSMYNLSGRVYWRVHDRFDITASYKSNERDNKTPVDVYTPILLEVWETGEYSNRPYGYERSQARVEARFRPVGNLRLNLGGKWDTIERTYQDVSETDEDTVWGEMAFSPWHWLDTRLKFDGSDRSAKDFEQLGNYGRPENPLMRKFNLAERERKRITAEFDVIPTENMSFTLSYYATDDEYDESVLGLKESEEKSFNLDFNYILGKETNLYAFFTDETIDAEISAAESFSAAPWDSSTSDEIQTWGVGVSGRIDERFTYGFDYVSSDADGNILTDSGAGEGPFPALTTELQNARVYLNFKINDRWGLGLDAYHEEYDTSDWYVDGIGPTDVTGLLGLGETSPDYSVNVIRLMATFRL